MKETHMTANKTTTTTSGKKPAGSDQAGTLYPG